MRFDEDASLICCRRMEEELAVLVNRRRTTSLRAERSDEIGWTEVDIGHGGFSYEKAPNGHDFILFNLRHSPLFRPILLRDIFLMFVTVDLIEEILGDMRPEDFPSQWKCPWSISKPWVSLQGARCADKNSWNTVNAKGEREK